MKRNAPVLVIATFLALVCNLEAATDEQMEAFFAASRAGDSEMVAEVLEPGPEYKEPAVHEFGEPLMATPAVPEGVLFYRTATKLIVVGK